MKFIKKIKTKLEKKSVGSKRAVSIVLFSVIAGLGSGAAVALATPYAPVSNIYSNIRVCNGAVSQPSEYTETSPDPTFNWSTSSLATGYSPTQQQAFYLEIDDNSNFASPEVSTGVVSSTLKTYTAPLGNLEFNTPYFWRVGVRDQRNSWTGWATENVAFCAPSYTYSCVAINPPACEFDDCGERIYGSAACQKTSGCDGSSTMESASVCESHGVTCFAPSQTCDVCPGGYKEATP